MATLKVLGKRYCPFHRCDTVDGRNPAPPGMNKTLVNHGISTISTGAAFPPSTVGVICVFPDMSMLHLPLGASLIHPSGAVRFSVGCRGLLSDEPMSKVDNFISLNE